METSSRSRPPANYDQPLPKRGRGGARWLIWLLLLVAVPAFGAFGYAAVSDPTLLDMFAPDPTRRPTIVALQTNRPSATGNASPTTNPTPANPAVATGPAAQFAALAADPSVSLRLQADATVRVGAEQLRMSMAIDQAGDDFTIKMTVRTDGRSATARVIVADGVAYGRAGRQAWRRVGDPDQLDVPDTAFAFSQLKADQAVLVRSETSRGRTLHLLRVPSTVATGFDPADLRRLGCDTDNLALEVWVRDDGTPVSATFDYACEARGERMVLSASYAFSKVNGDLAIKAPPKFR